MSDLRHQPDHELLRRLKSNAKYQHKLRTEIADLEQSVSLLKQRLGGSEEQSRWIVKYMEQNP